MGKRNERSNYSSQTIRWERIRNIRLNPCSRKGEPQVMALEHVAHIAGGAMIRARQNRWGNRYLHVDRLYHGKHRNAMGSGACNWSDLRGRICHRPVETAPTLVATGAPAPSRQFSDSYLTGPQPPWPSLPSIVNCYRGVRARKIDVPPQSSVEAGHPIALVSALRAHAPRYDTDSPRPASGISASISSAARLPYTRA